MIFIIYLISSLGICYAWNDTDVSRPFRNFVARIPYLRNFMLCHECSSFWISLLLSFWINPIGEYGLSSNVLLAFCGFFINLYFVRKKIIPIKD